jgi:purine-nucleoside phosphorylase
MPNLYDQIHEAAAAIHRAWSRTPTVGIILGTGLGNLTEDITTEAVIPYEDIPHFPRSTAPTHRGQLVCGTLSGKAIVAMEGRIHFYEGYTLQAVTFPVRVMKALGASVLIVSNACGVMNPQWDRGDLMLIEDHINLLGNNPLIGPNDDRLGIRFPDMCHAYDRELLKLGQRIAREERIVCRQGVFVAVSGPNLETRAEYRFLRNIGADVVGMSTVPEVIVAVHANLRVFGVSVITDRCLPDALEPVSLPDIIKTANETAPHLCVLVRRVVAEL